MSDFSGESIRVMHPLFQMEEDGSIPISPLSVRDLWIEELSFERARELNGLWHSKLPRMGTGFIKNQPFLSFAATYRGIIYAVVIWSNPVGRNLPQDTWMELRRLAGAPELPRNGCSWMLGRMARLIRRKRPEIERLVSYSIIGEHSGTIYKAAGWSPTSVNTDGNWTRTKRPRPKAQSENAKQRWELVLT